MSQRGDSLSRRIRAQLTRGSDDELLRARRSAASSRDQQLVRRASALLSSAATDAERSAAPKASGAARAAASGRSESQVRVLPGVRGGWRVEDIGGGRTLCKTMSDAEREAERLLRAAGGGEMCIYDAYLRVRAVKRLDREPEQQLC